MSMIETRHPLSPADRIAEAELRAELAHNAANPAPDRRVSYDAMVARTPLAEGVASEAVDVPGAHGHWLRPAGAPPDRAILYLHGGGYHLGSATAYRGLASQLARRAGVAAFVADYPLAPEAVFPAPYEAARATWSWLASQGIRRVALVGDSAGGGLGLAVLADAPGDAPRATCAVVFSPWTDLALESASMNATDTVDPVFVRDTIAGLARGALGGADPRDRRVSPLHDVPTGLPPLQVQVGSDERLRDEGCVYAARAGERGAAVELHVYEGMHHVFQHESARLEAARAALDGASAFLAHHLG
jgi:monoterpene epsilon-lactone hydrolase